MASGYRGCTPDPSLLFILSLAFKAKLLCMGKTICAWSDMPIPIIMVSHIYRVYVYGQSKCFPSYLNGTAHTHMGLPVCVRADCTRTSVTTHMHMGKTFVWDGTHTHQNFCLMHVSIIFMKSCDGNEDGS